MAKRRGKNLLLAGLAGLAAAAAAIVFGGPSGPDAGPGHPQPTLSVWSDTTPGFGGFSGMELTRGGSGLLAVSDGGLLFRASLLRDSSGAITAVKTERSSRFLDNLGRPAEGFHSDAEALRIAPDGSLLVAFEGYARVARFRPPDMMPQPLQVWDRFKPQWGNKGMEALSLAPDGQIMSVLEIPQPGGAYQSFVYRGGTEWQEGPDLASDGDFQATDADYGPDGRLYLLERDFSLPWGYSSRISAYPARDGGFAAPEVILNTAPGEYADFEGLDIWSDAQGRTIATVISDDNFLPLTPTTIAEFILLP